jgi:hypothetical protein
MTCVVCAFDRVDDMAAQRTSGGDYRCARHGGLGDPSATKDLCGSLTAPSGHEADPLFDPDGESPDAADVRNRYGRKRKEGRHGCALKLATAHFTA